MDNDSNVATVAVVGLGYIGLPTAAVLARSGCRVVGIDVNQAAVETIAAGRIHIEEPGLEEVVREAVTRGLLQVTTETRPADFFVIAVPTPFKEGHVPDVSYVMAAVESIAAVLKRGDVIIIESTSPVGTTEQASALLSRQRPDLRFPQVGDADSDVAICYCPERVLPGRILEEIVSNDRCIGGITPGCSEKALAFYRRFVTGDCIVTNARAAEMVKLTENAFRDVNIAFANEMSLVCETMNLDVWEVIALANRHPRVQVLNPGPGVGGHCIAVDPWFIVHADPERTPLIQAARGVNDGKPNHVIDRAVQMLDADPAGRLACLGLAFKADVDDMRESPAIRIAAELVTRYPDRIDVVEPFAAGVPSQMPPQTRMVSLDEALANCDNIVLLVDHQVFRTVPQSALTGKRLCDTRGIWPAAVTQRQRP